MSCTGIKRIATGKRGVRKIVRPEPLAPQRPIPGGLLWYVLSVQSGREYSVARWLEEDGQSFTLVPLETRWRLRDKRRAGKRAVREAYQTPLCPHFVLVGFMDQPNWLAVMNHFHILGVLGHNGEPQQIRFSEVLRIQSSSEGARRVASTQNDIKAGGQARIVAPGMFCGHVVEIKNLRGKRAVVAQNWFGQLREVEISTDDLEAA